MTSPRLPLPLPVPDLDGLSSRIVASLSGADKAAFLRTGHASAFVLHPMVGKYVRQLWGVEDWTKWGLWDYRNPLVQYFAQEFGTCHGEDIVAVVSDAVWASVNGVERTAPGIFRDRFAEKWAEVGLDPVTGTRLDFASSGP